MENNLAYLIMAVSILLVGLYFTIPYQHQQPIEEDKEVVSVLLTEDVCAKTTMTEQEYKAAGKWYASMGLNPYMMLGVRCE